MEFGAKVDPGESFVEAARREAHEESNDILNIPLETLEKAERLGDYVDYYNQQSGMFYRMYCVLLEKVLDVSGFTADKAHVEKHKLVYWPTKDVIHNNTWTLSDGTEIYPTSTIRYSMLRDKKLSWM